MNTQQIQPAPRTYVNDNGHTIVDHSDGSWENLTTGESYDAASGLMTDPSGVQFDTRV